jgi:CRP-like cAMP-binding protein
VDSHGQRGHRRTARARSVSESTAALRATATVIKQGDIGDEVFTGVSGEATVRIKPDKGESKQAVLKADDHFVDNASRRDFAAAASIIQQGDTGDEFLIIESGQASAHIEPDKGGSKQVAELKAGDHFVDNALKRDCAACASIIKQGDIGDEFFISESGEASELIRPDTGKRKQDAEVSACDSLVDKASPAELAAGSSIIKQGDTGDEFLTIEAGEATSHIKPDTLESKQVAGVKADDYFVDNALLRESAAGASRGMGDEFLTIESGEAAAHIKPDPGKSKQDGLRGHRRPAGRGLGRGGPARTRPHFERNPAARAASEDTAALRAERFDTGGQPGRPATTRPALAGAASGTRAASADTGREHTDGPRAHGREDIDDSGGPRAADGAGEGGRTTLSDAALTARTVGVGTGPRNAGGCAGRAAGRGTRGQAGGAAMPTQRRRARRLRQGPSRLAVAAPAAAARVRPASAVAAAPAAAAAGAPTRWRPSLPAAGRALAGPGAWAPAAGGGLQAAAARGDCGGPASPPRSWSTIRPSPRRMGLQGAGAGQAAGAAEPFCAQPHPQQSQRVPRAVASTASVPGAAGAVGALRDGTRFWI